MRKIRAEFFFVERNKVEMEKEEHIKCITGDCSGGGSIWNMKQESKKNVFFPTSHRGKNYIQMKIEFNIYMTHIRTAYMKTVFF